MKKLLILFVYGSFFVQFVSNANAGAGGMLDSFRELTGVIKEVANTKKELEQAKQPSADQQYQQQYPQTQYQQQPSSAQTQQYPPVQTYPQQDQYQPVNQQYTQDVYGILQAGDVLVSKIANVKIYKMADNKSTKVAQLTKAADIVYMGEELNGYYRVKSAKGDGWVEKLLVKKQL